MSSNRYKFVGREDLKGISSEDVGQFGQLPPEYLAAIRSYGEDQRRLPNLRR